MTWLLLSGLVVLACSWMLTALVRIWALKTNRLDAPNARSSHLLPTPRGGGLGFVLVLLITVPVLCWFDWVPFHLTLGLVGSTGLVALVGFIDDRGHVSALWRLLTHLLAVAWALYCLGSLPPLSVAGFELQAGPVAWLLALLGLVWLLNLFNFMDGIDGIAGVQAVSVLLVMACLHAVGGFAGVTLLSLSALAVLGFLYWNWPPARIFMGDVGSGFLGLWLGILMMWAGLQAVELFWAWLVMSGVFVMDASLTLLRRLLRGEKVYQAHRSHAYQWMSRRWGSHRAVTLAVLAINVCWLAPWAWVAVMGVLPGEWVLLLAWLPLGMAALCLGAGKLETRDAA